MFVLFKVMSGDDDLPKRDDIGERRRKHENRGLASAGIQSDDDDELQNDEATLDGGNDTNKDGETELKTDLYKETKIKRDAKLASTKVFQVLYKIQCIQLLFYFCNFIICKSVM